eukprot:274720-Amphidinium_carterae.1
MRPSADLSSIETANAVGIGLRGGGQAANAASASLSVTEAASAASAGLGATETASAVGPGLSNKTASA